MTSLPFQNQVAVVTGASRGIGRAIALHLAEKGATLCLVARSGEGLAEVAAHAPATGARVFTYPLDLTLDESVQQLGTALRQDVGRLDILVHCAGTISVGPIEAASPHDFDRQYLTNVRAPYTLTQALLPMLVPHQGQIVFVNSSVIRAPRPNVSQFAATQHALKAVADSLREEVNARGVRVLSVFPGRTATERQATIHQWEGKPYRQELLLQPQDVAAVIGNALELPRTAEVTDIHIRPMNKT